MDANSTPTAPVTVGSGKVVHLATDRDGNLGVDCGAVRYRNITTRTVTRQAAGTEITCGKCLAQIAKAAPAVEVQSKAVAIFASEARPTCKCACGSFTKGGSYLPGHDARHASQVAQAITAGADADEAVAALSPRLAVKALRQAGRI